MTKKDFLTLGLLFTAALCYGVERTGRMNENVVLNTGNDPVMYKHVVGATAVQISTGAITRARLVCRNTGAVSVLIGSGTLAATSSNAFYVGEGTSTISTFDTNSTGSFYAIVGNGLTGPANVYCQEDR